MKRGFIIGLVCCGISSLAQNQSVWVDSVFNKMSLNEKIGQLFMLPVSAYASPQESKALEGLIKTYKPGSIYITKGSAKSHIRVANQLQKVSKIPLLFGLNAEWGLGQTLDSTFNFPMPMIAGANQNNELIKSLGHQIGLQMNAVGAHINFAPNADIDVPFESMVTLRYFGSNKNKVAMKSIAFAEGLKEAGVMAVAKHLPGILPGTGEAAIGRPFVSIGPDTLSFYPYQKLIDANMGGLFTSYMHFNTMEGNTTVPAPLSQVFISDIIKRQTGFNGLAFADVPYLTTILKKEKGETEKTAFQVGNDVLIAPSDISQSIKKISRLVKKDKALMAQLDASVKKILKAKFLAGLNKEKVTEPTNLDEKLFSVPALQVDRQLKEGAITLLKNASALVPIQTIDHRKFKLIAMDGSFPIFEKSLNRYVPFERIKIASLVDTIKAEREMAGAVSIVALQTGAKNYSGWLKKISKAHPVIVCHFGNPADLKYLADVPVLLEGYDTGATGDVMAQAIFGAIAIRGKLPVGIDGIFPEGTGYESSALERLSYTLPEDAQMDGRHLNKIDSIVNEAVNVGATPGARVMVARKGKVVFDKSFGWQGNDKKIPVTESTIYDLASVTKVSATLQAVMFMHERGMLDINKKISVYLPEFKESNKKDIIIKDILTHQAGLWPYFPWHVDIVKDSVRYARFFQDTCSTDFPFQVSGNLYSHKSMRDSMWHWIVNSKMIEKKDRTPYEYRYSDLGLYIMQRLVERSVNQPLEDFVTQNFYEPLGASTTGFLPLSRFPEDQIAPTENDTAFRKSLLVGHVHDPGAAMHGGVAGHAGLFSNANDLLKLGQLWLQKGRYGGVQYFKPETIDLYTTKQFETSRRGLGWDKPTGDWNGSTGVYCSPLTFGHTGFTGTCIWVDPQFDLVYVFLSNRVHPEINGKLMSHNIRTRIHDVIYESIFNYSSSH
jgi:beta-N-acetylhexosaminidase